MAKDRILAVEFVVDSHDLLAHVGRRAGRTLKLRAIGRRRENAGAEKRLCVCIQHARRYDVIGERLALYDSGRCDPAGAVGEQNRRRHIGLGRAIDSRHVNCFAATAKVSAILARQRHLLIIVAALTQVAPFHVVKEECRMRLAPGHLSSHIKAKRVVIQLGYRVGSRVEVVTSIKRVVTVEIPGRRMISLGSRLDNAAQGSRGGQAV